MIFRPFKKGQYLPAGTNAHILRVRAIPFTGEGWRMFAYEKTLVARGRFAVKDASLTGLTIQFSPTTDDFGGSGSLDGTLVAITSTSTTQGNAFGVPIVNFYLNGTNAADTSHGEFAIYFGWPVRGLIVQATGIQLYPVGTDLTDPKFGMVEAW